VTQERLFEVNIDHERCDECGICIFECGSRVFQWDWKEKTVVPSGQSECTECFICEIKCPHGAIELTLPGNPGARIRTDLDKRI
jgi:NAD-dependent dihydropyrimidine dehydrogenase PreA subunit